MPYKMKVMEFEIKLVFPLYQINSFVLVKVFLAVKSIWTISSTNQRLTHFILKSSTQQINMDIYLNIYLTNTGKQICLACDILRYFVVDLPKDICDFAKKMALVSFIHIDILTSYSKVRRCRLQLEKYCFL